MPCIALAAAAVPKVSPRTVNALVSCSSASWRETKYPVHFFHICSSSGFPSYSEQSLEKELVARSECVAKAERRSSNKGRPVKSTFFCASYIALKYSGMRVSLVQKYWRRRGVLMTSA